MGWNVDLVLGCRVPATLAINPREGSTHEGKLAGEDASRQGGRRLRGMGAKAGPPSWWGEACKLSQTCDVLGPTGLAGKRKGLWRGAGIAGKGLARPRTGTNSADVWPTGSGRAVFRGRVAGPFPDRQRFHLLFNKFGTVAAAAAVWFTNSRDEWEGARSISAGGGRSINCTRPRFYRCCKRRGGATRQHQ